MEKVKGALTGAKEGWLKIDTKKRITMIVIITVVILLASIITFNTNKVDYATLFTNLEMQDAGVIVNDLETKGIKYKLESNGRNILIDKDLVDEYRLELAMNGMMPESSTGFEIFDNTGMMVTDEDRQIMYQRALTGELQRSIMSLDAINSAKVLLVMPEKSIFETEAKEASASVVIDIKPTQKVTQDMIKGMAALISGAVDNMPMSNIQIIDSRGNLLSGFLNEEEGINTLDIATQHQKIRSKFEDEIEANLMHLLGSALGINKVRVSVLADMDFDAEESTVITYSDPVTRSEQVDASGGNLDIQTITGGNIDDNISNVVGNQDGDNSTFSKTTNNELSSESKTTVKAPGKINKLTTSVLYDGQISDVDLLKIQSIVATATGYDMDRGDLISIEGITFDKTAQEELQAELDRIAAEELANQTIFTKYGDYIMYGVSGLLGLFLIVFLIRRFATKNQRAEDRLFQEKLALDSTKEGILAASDEDDSLKVAPDGKGDKAKNYAKENPELAADLIKAWMKES